MDKIKGFVVVGVSPEYEVSVYTFKHLKYAIDFIKAAKHLSNIYWEVHECNSQGGVSDAVSLFKQSVEKDHA